MLNAVQLSRIDLNLLVLFEIVLEERNVGRAAEQLNLTASAVSHGLNRLRALFGDPLFLRAPKGVVPTERALLLAEPVGEILVQIRRVVASSGPFDPATATRRFTIGTPDALASVFLPPLLEMLRRSAPGIQIIIRPLLPSLQPRDPAIIGLDERSIDVAITPLDDVPSRFAAELLLDEDFVIASRPDHPYAMTPSLDRYCAAEHVFVSLQSSDARGLVDRELEKLGRSRHVALVVPNFLLALELVARTDVIAAVPRHFFAAHRGRFGLVATEAPMPLLGPAIRVVVPRAALADAGTAWLYEEVRRGGYLT